MKRRLFFADYICTRTNMFTFSVRNNKKKPPRLSRIQQTLHLKLKHKQESYVQTTLPHVLFTLCVFVYVEWCPTHIVLCFLFRLSSSCVPNIASYFELSIQWSTQY
jgi:hypothetical protein